MIAVAIDPGKSMGWAVYQTSQGWYGSAVPPENWRLMWCGATDGDAPAFPSVVVLPIGRVDLCYIEKPQVYHDNHAKRVDPNDLITLACRAGFAAGRVNALRTVYILPRDWKKQVPKPIHHGRIAKHLDAREVRLLDGAKEDTWDAVGLGLFGLGRMRAGG